MKINRKFTGCFDLNEVLDVLNPHVDSMTKTVMNEEYKNYSEFLCSYAPYTIVSDIAANEQLATDGFDMETLSENVDLHPTTLAGRVCKASILSEARCSFGMGFFTKSHNGNVTDSEMSDIMDRIYSNLKYLSRRGADTLARVLSYYHAKRALSLYQIYKIGELFKDNKDKLSPALICGIILCAIECYEYNDLRRIMHIMKLMGESISERHEGGFAGKPDASFTAKAVMKGALAMKCVGASRIYSLEQGKDLTYGSAVVDYLTELSVVRADEYDTGLYEFCFDKTDYSEVVGFGEKLGAILKGEADA